MSVDRGLNVVVCVRPPSGDAAAPGDDRVLGALDLRAVDYAVRLGRQGGAQIDVTAIAAGNERALATLRECLAMGVDRAVHLPVEDDQPQVDGLALARRLAPAVADLRPDLVLCGSRSHVGMRGTVPRALAHSLGLPFVGSVVELDLDHDGPVRSARAVQRLERGDRWAWGCDLPMVCAVERDLCAPRYLAVRRLARAQAASPEIRSAPADIVKGPDGAGTLVLESRNPSRIRPKKTATAPTAAMSAADRMKLLRGGGKPPAADGDEDDKPRRVADDPERAAAEIVKLLEKHDLL